MGSTNDKNSGGGLNSEKRNENSCVPRVYYREIAYLLSHLRSVEEHLDPEWARAFLRRTRFMESDFQGDILSVFC